MGAAVSAGLPESLDADACRSLATDEHFAPALAAAPWLAPTLAGGGRARKRDALRAWRQYSQAVATRDAAKRVLERERAAARKYYDAAATSRRRAPRRKTRRRRRDATTRPSRRRELAAAGPDQTAPGPEAAALARLRAAVRGELVGEVDELREKAVAEARADAEAIRTAGEVLYEQRRREAGAWAAMKARVASSLDRVRGVPRTCWFGEKGGLWSAK